MIIIDDALQCLKNVEVDKKEFILRGIVESIGVIYIGKKRYRKIHWFGHLIILFRHNQLTIV